MPKCAVPLASAEVVVSGTTAMPDDLESECSPACNDPSMLLNASLCEANSEMLTG